jgi:two-component system, OmpR family, response regulator RegX3
MHIGLLEDDEDQRRLISLWLRAGGHTHREYGTIAEMTEGLKRESFDLLLLDWVLPDGNSEEVIHWVRRNLGWEVAVVVLTARDEESGVVQALQAGADDYVVKPPKQNELIARLSAAARRARPGGLPVLHLGVYEVDIQRHVLSMEGAPVSLTQKEFDLAVYLFQSPGKLLSRDHLLNKIWGLNTDVDTRTVDTHVSRLRKKLLLDGSRGWKMSPVYGYGYRLDRIDAPVS